MSTNTSNQIAILDVCCGSRSMWFERNHKHTVFGDIRHETVTVTDRSHGKRDGTRVLTICPDIMMDFTALPFADCTFGLVAFDPPHLRRGGPQSWMVAKYGRLSGNWKDDLVSGFRECFRVLKPGGTLVFKWNETHVKVSEVLRIAPQRPLFGQVSGRSGFTHWLVFMKEF